MWWAGRGDLLLVDELVAYLMWGWIVKHENLKQLYLFQAELPSLLDIMF